MTSKVVNKLFGKGNAFNTRLVKKSTAKAAPAKAAPRKAAPVKASARKPDAIKTSAVRANVPTPKSRASAVSAKSNSRPSFSGLTDVGLTKGVKRAAARKTVAANPTPGPKSRGGARAYRPTIKLGPLEIGGDVSAYQKMQRRNRGLTISGQKLKK